MLTNGTNINSFGNDLHRGGAGNDEIFGQLGNDTIQGDGSIDVSMTGGQPVFAFRDANNALQINPSFEVATDGKTILRAAVATISSSWSRPGRHLGGSSDSSRLPAQSTPDGSDMIFGGAGHTRRPQRPRRHLGDRPRERRRRHCRR